MKKAVLTALIIGLALCPSVNAKPLSDAKIKNILIKESISEYPGNCPCPYNTARNGSSCGRRSAYSRAGGNSPLCYPGDVTAQMVKEYRKSHK